MMRIVRYLYAVVLLPVLLSLGLGAAQVGDEILNTAKVGYTLGGEEHNTTTNEVNLTIAATPATIEFLQLENNGSAETLQTTTYEGASGTTPMSPATLPDGTVIPTPSEQNMTVSSLYTPRDLVIIRVVDLDQNTHIDTIQVIDVNVTNPRTGEIETLHLRETNASSGVFVGYLHTKPCPESTSLPAATVDRRDGTLCVGDGDRIDAIYIDNGTLRQVKVKAVAKIVAETFALLVTKSQSKEVASIGEHLKYTVLTENVGKHAYPDVRITDRLPDGVKYVAGSFRVDGAKAPDPILAPDGKSFTYTHPLLKKGESVKISYVAIIGAGTANHEAINTAWAQAPGTKRSNIATTKLTIREELWRSKGFILGQVTEADSPCEGNTTKGVTKSDAAPPSSVVGLDGQPHPKPGCGVEGVKLYMEDGRYVVTDKNGRYHFVDVANGTHVVQIDEYSIKGRYTIEQCERTTRFAGRARSQFVEVHHGGLNRADFCLRRIPGVTGRSLLEIKIHKRTANTVRVSLKINATMDLIDPEVFLSLSDGLAYVPRSATTEAEPQMQEDILVVKMGTKREVTLALKVTDVIIPDKELRAILYYDTRLAKDQHSDMATVLFTTDKGKAVIDRITQDRATVSGESVGGTTPVGEGDYNWTKPTHQITMPQYTEEEVDKLGKTPAIVWPPKGWIPDIPSTRVAILYPKGHTVELRLNGRKVSPLNYEGLFRGTNGMQIMHYKGVDLAEGANTFTALIKKGNRIIKRLSRTVYVESHAPKQITLLPHYSWLVADGKHEPIVAVKMIGPSGHPLRGGMVGSFTTDSAHAPAQMSNDRGAYTIDSEGIAYVRLKPTAIAGEASLTFKLYGDHYQTIRVRLKPHLRDWIVVGFAEGTVGYRRLSGNAQGLENQGVKEGLYVDGRLAFFAKGRIKGGWLLTMAYDSGRKKGDRKLFDAIDPNAWYTIYQDATSQGSEAPSTKKLYLKLEKDAWMLLFGDYHTEVDGGEFTSYHRDFTGGKVTYHGANIEAVAFAAKTDKLHYRQEIRPDGTSGYYTLTHTPLLEGSEQITLEVRDRHHPEIVLERREMERWREYTIDYDTGKIYFKEPIPTTDKAFNPRTIVVRYDVEGDGESHYTYGGRVTFGSDDHKLKIGASAIREEHGDGADRLLGVDARYQTGEHSELLAELAQTRSTHEQNTSTGIAYKVEWSYQDDNTSLRTYWRYQDGAFGLGNLPEVLSATRMIGMDAARQLNACWSVGTTLYQNRRYDANGTTNDEVVFEPTLRYADQNWSASIGYRYAKNTLTPATHQMTLALSHTLMDDRLKLSLAHDQSLGTNQDRQFPTRTTLGADYKVDDNLSLFASLERSDLDGDVTWRSQMGASLKPWEGGSIKVSRLFDVTSRGLVGYDTIGVNHTWKARKKWTFAAGYEMGIAELESTQEDFQALHIGGGYEGDRYSGEGRVEYRHAKSGQKLNLDLGLYVRQDKDLGLAAGLGWHTTWNTTDLHRDLDAKLALVYRPDARPWIVLDRLDYIDQYDENLTETTRTRKLVNNLAAIYHPDDRWEIGLQYGLKYVLDQIDGANYGGWVDLWGLDVRYNLNKTWALGLQGSMLHAYGARNMDYGGGVFVETSPWENAVVTFGYNVAGFEDDDFSLQNYRHQGPYLRVKMKFDQEDIRKVVKGVAQ